MSKLINRLISDKIMKNKTFLILGVIAIVIAASLVSFNLLNLNQKETEEQEIEKSKSDSAIHYFTYQIDSFEVPTTIVNGSINTITKNDDTNSILVEITTLNQGYLIIQIPKTMLKALNDDYSKFYFIIISDGEETSYEQIDAETIKINFKHNAKKIEIIGASQPN